jgi:hypothetical protein
MTDQTSALPAASDIILKELDHIQAIMARFDTFFFLMKQVCLAGITALFGISASNKLKVIPFFIWIIPLVFWMLEASFRFAYWTRYVDRVATIKEYLQGKTRRIELYVIVEPQGPLMDMERWRSVFLPFDKLYYVVWAALSLIAALLLVCAGG